MRSGLCELVREPPSGSASVQAKALTLRDNIAANLTPFVNNNFADLQAKVNAILPALSRGWNHWELIRLRTIIAGPRMTAGPGETINVDTLLGTALVQAGYADLVGAPPPAIQASRNT